MDLAAPEMLRVAKEAYTYQYELQLRKEQNEGELNKELASLRETLSSIRAEIATYQAQMDTARERETNRANVYAHQRLAEARGAANANAALLEAQALDIRSVSSASAPEILAYRYQQEVLERLGAVADRLPQVVQVGDGDGQTIDFLAIAGQMIGTGNDPLYTQQDMQSIRERLSTIEARIRERAAEIEHRMADGDPVTDPLQGRSVEEETARRVEEIRQSVTDQQIQERVERIGHTSDGEQPTPPTGDGDGRVEGDMK